MGLNKHEQMQLFSNVSTETREKALTDYPELASIILAAKSPNGKQNGPHKHNAARTEVDGVKYDSTGEKDRHYVLMQWQETGIISGLKLKPTLVVQEKFSYRGKKFQQITWTPDFRYYDKEYGVWVFEDWKRMDKKTGKAYMTEDFKVKIKIVLFRYPDNHFFINCHPYGRYSGSLYSTD